MKTESEALDKIQVNYKNMFLREYRFWGLLVVFFYYDQYKMEKGDELNYEKEEFKRYYINLNNCNDCFLYQFMQLFKYRQ